MQGTPLTQEFMIALSSFWLAVVCGIYAINWISGDRRNK